MIITEQQIAIRNNFIEESEKTYSVDSLSSWKDFYFKFGDTTMESSRKVKDRDITLFIEFMKKEYKTDKRELWTPRLSKQYQNYLKNNTNQEGTRHWNDRTVNRIIAHLKTFSKFIHKYLPFPLGNPMEKVRGLAIASYLEIEKGITEQERNLILDSADFLLTQGGISKDRNRYRKKERPQRKTYRPYRNRAIIYTLVETGMRRSAPTKINLNDVKFDDRVIYVEEKGGKTAKYPISKMGLEAIKDYLESGEREMDNEKWKSPALFLPAKEVANSNGRLTPLVINQTWNKICEKAGVKNRSPHSARHGMGNHIIKKTGNASHVQTQLNHGSKLTSMEYTRPRKEDLQEVLDER